MMTSIEGEVEAQLLNAITTAGVTGVNLYGADRSELKLLPYVFTDVEIASEDIAPFTGIFSCVATIQYRSRADSSSNQSFDDKFASVLQAFYTEPNLAEQMTTASSDLTFYMANVRQVNPTVMSVTRTWSKDIIMDLKVTAK
jgi:hypothetical protein